MTDKPNDLLLTAGKVLTILMQVIIAIGAAALLIAIPAILFNIGKINVELASEFGGSLDEFPTAVTTGLMLLALTMLGLAFLFFDRLRTIIGTVGKGDPFDPINADRLSMMAWLLLGIQVLALPAAGLGLMIAKWAEPISHEGMNVDFELDFSGVLMVITLFILARVFKHGAAMREDLEGTV